ncbi:DUF2894 domain-containing protein [Dyella silvae]|uniref:DUF2894 domain-containing protein n=1 Tax=Dyella silvae TaxID=2994424 RepID=UPI0022649448|nr:DUF2894 domain-containing protein [Dyella silvae]
MSNRKTTARTALDAWREQQADRLDPIRFHLMEALERRVARHEGEARRLLDGKLSVLVEAYAGDLARAAPRGGDVEAPDAATNTTLVGLVDLIASHASARVGVSVPDHVTAQPAVPATLEALGEFRKIWSRLRTESQLRQSMEPAPTNAGPLNSSALVHRSIALMRELSPGYLQHFLSYVDDLSSLEPLGGISAVTAGDAPQAAATAKKPRSRSRARRE